MSWINKTVALFVGLALVACSKQEPQALQTESSTHSESAYTGPKETVSLALNASLDGNEARALQGSVFHRGRLRPNITNGKVEVWLYLGSQGTGTSQLYKEKLEFDYNKETNSVHYRGEIQAPQGLLGASDLKMLLVVANGAKIANDVLTMRNVNTEVFEDRTFADGDDLVLDVPYFSKWMDVHGFVTTSYNEKQKKMEPFLDVARTDVLLRPQGHVIKMELSSSVTALDNLNIRALQIESNAITDGGTYALPTSADHIGVQPVFTPDLTTDNVPATHKFRKIVLPVDKAVDNSKTRTIFLWVAQIPGQTEQTWTRTFARVEIPHPVLNEGFTINPDTKKSEAWWNGASTEEDKKKLFPVYYTQSNFARTGSTMTMRLDNITVISPITRMAYSYASQSVLVGGFSYEGYTGGPNLPLGLAPTWAARFFTDYSHYTFDWLAQNNYLGDNPNPIVFDANSAGDPNSRGVEFYIPTIEEFRAILPTESSLSPIFRYASSNNTPAQTVTERVKLGNRKTTAPKNYESTYKYFSKAAIKKYYPKDDNDAVIAVRFKGGDNRHKTVYRYRGLGLGNSGTGSVQLQAMHLGEFFPEINTPQDVFDFKTNYPGATPPLDITPEERILPLNRNNFDKGTFQGNLYWVNNVSGNTATYFEYEYANGRVAERTTTLGQQRPQENVLILMRDFK